MATPFTESQIRGTYSPSLREHPGWQALESILTTAEFMHQWKPDDPFDFTFEITRETHAALLDVLFVSPSCLVPMHRDKTIARIERCMQMATVSAAIAFLFIENPQQDGKGEQCSLDGFLDLQLLLAQYLPQSLPLIPIHDPSCFVECIKEHMEGLASAPRLPSPGIDPLAILPRMASMKLPVGYPGYPDTDGILGVLFPSLRSMSQAARTQEGMALLDAYFGPEVSSKLSGFLQHDSSAQ